MSLCLNMIVKNESHIILETLNNLLSYLKFDYWVISDTGSTDQTPQLITDFFKEKGIPGEMFLDEWKDFGHNRTIALEHAYQKTDYLFIFDADDKIMGQLTLPVLDADEYRFKLGQRTQYYRSLLINNRKRWKFVGVLHEYLTSMEEDIQKKIIEGDYYIDSRRLGDRSKASDKYEKDAMILVDAYETEKDEGLKHRYAFYAGQSFKDCGQDEKSIEWNKLVLTLKNWSQEKFIACLRIGEIYEKQKNFESALHYYTKTIEYDKERIEGIVHACRLCYEKGMHLLVHSFYEQFKHVDLKNINLTQKLFLFPELFQDDLSYYNTISSYYIHNTVSGYESCKRNLIHNRISKSRLYNAIHNLYYYREEIKKDTDSKELFNRVHTLLFEKGMNEKITDNDILVMNLLREQSTCV